MRFAYEAPGRGTWAVQRARIAIVTVLVLLSLFTIGLPLSASGPSSSSFTFAAAGGLDPNANTNSSLVRLAASSTNFFLPVGALPRSTITPGPSWRHYGSSTVRHEYP